MRHTLGPTQTKVYQALQNAPAGLDWYAIRQATGLTSRDSLGYALDSLEAKGFIVRYGSAYSLPQEAPLEEHFVAMTAKKLDKIQVYYFRPLKKTGAPIVIKNAATGSMISTSRLILDRARAAMSYDNAPPGLKAKGPTTILEIEVEGEE